MPYDLPVTPLRRQAGLPRRETPFAAAMFAEYCALGPGRTLKALALKVTGGNERRAKAKQNYLGRLSIAFHWGERVKAYDREYAEAERRRREARWHSMNDNHARIGDRAIHLAIDHIERILANPEDRRYGLQSLANLLKIAGELERSAVDAAYQHDQGTGPGEVQIVLLTDERPALPAPGVVVDGTLEDDHAPGVPAQTEANALRQE